MYFGVSFAAVRSIAAVAFVGVSPICEFTNVSGMVTSDASALPLVYGISVAPPGLVPSDLDNPTGLQMQTVGYCAFFTDHQIMSIHLCVTDLPQRTFPARQAM